MLRDIRFGHADSQGADTRDNANPFCYRDCAACIQQIEQVRAFQAKIVSGEHGKAAKSHSNLDFRRRNRFVVAMNHPVVNFFLPLRFMQRFGREVFVELRNQRLAFRLVQSKVLPQLGYVGELKIVDGELKFFCQPNFAIRDCTPGHRDPSPTQCRRSNPHPAERRRCARVHR